MKKTLTKPKDIDDDTPATIEKPKGRIRWEPRMERELVLGAYKLAKDGKTADNRSFKEADWKNVATRVRPVYYGPYALDWKNCKSKWEDKFKALWRLWLEHAAVEKLSGWGVNEEGLPQADEEVMDEYFTAHPQFAKFRHSLPEYYAELGFIFGNSQLANGSAAFVVDDDSPNEDVMEITSDMDDDNGEAKKEAKTEQESNRSSRESSASSHQSSSRKKRSAESINYRKKLAEKEWKIGRRSREETRGLLQL